MLALSVSDVSARKRLVIVHVNDTHSHLDPERSGRNRGRGGVIERAAFIDSVRKADGKNNVLLLHAGDWDQGSPYFTVLKGDLEASLINALEYDCLTPGNHEFDNGIEDLCRRINMINCPVVCANYDFSSFSNRITPYTIIKRGGKKIGIVGMLTDISTVVAGDTSSRLPKLGNDADIVNKWASFLKDDKKCDIVIVLSHLGYEEDVELIPLTRNVDMVIGGHSHTVLREPKNVTDLDGNIVPIVQDGNWGLSVGLVSLEQ